MKNEKWVTRINALFTQLDTNKNGYLSRDDWLLSVDNLAKVVTNRPAEIAKLREVVIEYTEALGVTEGVKADKQKFLELLSVAVADDIAKFKKGEKTLTERFAGAYFDVVDQNHDGCINWDEYKIVMEASGFPEESARGTFELLDKNKNGKIERKELIAADIKFWCDLEEKETDELFGKTFF